MIKMQVREKNRNTRNLSFVVLISDMFLLKIWHPLRKSPEGLNLKMKNIIICVYLRNTYGMVIGNWKKYIAMVMDKATLLWISQALSNFSFYSFTTNATFIIKALLCSQKSPNVLEKFKAKVETAVRATAKI